MDGRHRALIIDRYIIAEIARPFGLGVVTLLAIFTGYSTAVRLADAAQELMQVSSVVKLILLNTLVAMEILLPTALYLSVLSAIGRLHVDSEMVALKAAGISERRIAMPVFSLAIIVAVVVGLLSLYGRPWAYRENYRLEAEAVSGFSIDKMEAGRFLVLQGGRHVLFAGRIDREQNLLREVFLQTDQGDKSRVIHASEALLNQTMSGGGYVVEFHDGYSFLLDRLGPGDVTLRFGTLVVDLQVDADDASYRRKAAPTVSLAHSKRPRDIAEYQWRLSTPLATLLLALLAVPLSRGSHRRSRFRGYFIAILVYTMLFNLIILARNLVEQGAVGSMPGLWWAYAFPAGLLAVLLLKPRLLDRSGRT